MHSAFPKLKFAIFFLKPINRELGGTTEEDFLCSESIPGKIYGARSISKILNFRISRIIKPQFNFQESMSPTSRLIECPKPVCAKKFRDLDALKYHLSYAHNDLKKAAALAAQKRQQKILDQQQKLKAEKEKIILNGKNSSKQTVTSAVASPVKKQETGSAAVVSGIIKKENGALNNNTASKDIKPEVNNSAPTAVVKTEPGIKNEPHNSIPIKTEPSVVKTDPVKPEIAPVAATGNKIPMSNTGVPPAGTKPILPVPLVTSNNDAPLNLQKRPVSPAYSDISDEEPSQPPPHPNPLPHVLNQPHKGMPMGLPSLNNLANLHRPPPLSSSSSMLTNSLSSASNSKPTPHILQQPPPPPIAIASKSRSQTHSV